MSYSLDVKVITWERLEFDSKEEMEDVKSKLESKELISSSDVADYLRRSFNTIDEVTEDMSLDDNDNQSTMEITNEDGNTIWQNGDCYDEDGNLIEKN